MTVRVLLLGYYGAVNLSKVCCGQNYSQIAMDIIVMLYNTWREKEEGKTRAREIIFTE